MSATVAPASATPPLVMVPEIVTRVIALAEVNELAKNIGAKIATKAKRIMREKFLLLDASFSVMGNPKNHTRVISTPFGH